jgi:hypothetical protein
LETIRGLQLELTVYELANASPEADRSAKIRRRAAELLRSGQRSPGWSFELNLERAEVQGSARAVLANLRLLADSICSAPKIPIPEELLRWLDS